VACRCRADFVKITIVIGREEAFKSFVGAFDCRAPWYEHWYFVGVHGNRWDSVTHGESEYNVRCKRRKIRGSEFPIEDLLFGCVPDHDACCVIVEAQNCDERNHCFCMSKSEHSELGASFKFRIEDIQDIGDKNTTHSIVNIETITLLPIGRQVFPKFKLVNSILAEQRTPKFNLN